MRTHIASLLLLAVVVLPAPASAAQVAPDEIVDPAAAVALAAAVPDVAPVPAPAPAPAPAPTVHIAAVPPQRASEASVPRSTSATAAATHFSGRTLPFTGVDPRQLIFLFLVSSLLVVAGVTARAAGRPVSQRN